MNGSTPEAPSPASNAMPSKSGCLDIQECPQADLAICAAIIGVAKKLVGEHWSTFEAQKQWDRESLLPIFDRCITAADEAAIENSRYLKSLGLQRPRATGAELWRHLIESCYTDGLIAAEYKEVLDTILTQGPLARRLVKAVGEGASLQKLHSVYSQLSDCLQQNRMFIHT